jgi:hypothetical protein
MLNIFLPRGIRNNNPGNIRLSKTSWLGQKPAQGDHDFVEFDTPLHGLRALMKLLLTYRLRHGLDSVESIINRFAPPHENATDHYIHQVCKTMGVKRRDCINVFKKETLCLLAKAIVLHENGRPPEGRPRAWLDEPVYDQAADAALSGIQSPKTI